MLALKESHLDKLCGRLGEANVGQHWRRQQLSTSVSHYGSAAGQAKANLARSTVSAPADRLSLIIGAQSND
jgi:hypothetical protein